VQIIDEVKSFVRFEREQTVTRAVALAEVVHELVEFLRFDRSLPLEKLRVRIESEPVVRANQVKLQQVLINLLKNAEYAIRGREDGRISLTLSAAGGQASLVVSDNGCGMAPDVVERIWEPFFSTKGEEGTGLGLDVAKSFIEGHGGTITCESAPGAGATFTIRLPEFKHNESAPSATAPLPIAAALPPLPLPAAQAVP
jgi:C4-dicarboxylate-specific signal transduction histidine kinase